MPPQPAMSVGYPHPAVELRLVDGDDRDATEGVLQMKSPAMLNGYHGLPEATRLAKLRDAQGRTWHRMGDLGAMDAQGRLWFHGRKAELVRDAQGDLTTESVEPAFADHPKVRRCALVGIGAPGRQSAPLVVAAVSWPLLGERVSLKRWLAICGGLVGVFIALRPGGEGLVSLAGVAAAASAGTAPGSRT
jgi:acyl-coenzyme A synthetase/AMP-(fatty) acid ligase